MASETDSSKGKSTIRPKRRRRAITILVVLLGILIIAHWWWGRIERRRLDALVARLAASGDPITLEQLRATSVPDRENAARALIAAAALVDSHHDLYYRQDDLDFPLTESEAAKLKPAVASNAQALSLLRDARRRHAFSWDYRPAGPPLAWRCPDLVRQDDLIDATGLAIAWAHHCGDDAQAMEHVRDLLQMARVLEIPSNRHLASVARSTAAEWCQKLAPDLRITTGGGAGPDLVRQVIQELLDDEGPREGYLRSLEFRRAAILDAGYAVAEGRLTLELATGYEAPADWLFEGYLGRPMALRDTRQLVRELTTLLQAAREPVWPRARAMVPPGASRVVRPCGEHEWHYVAMRLNGSGTGNLQWLYVDQADRRLAAAALALRWYAADHEGRFPDSLGQLVPAYLSRIPDDPMAATQKPISYLMIDGGPVLYSIGTDGKDDHVTSTPMSVSAHDRWNWPDAVIHLKRQPRLTRE